MGKLNKAYIKDALWLVIPIISFFGVQFALKTTLHTQFPLAAVESPSMWPVLQVGDLIVVQGVDVNDIQVGSEGDIIVFYDPSGRVRRRYLFIVEPVLIVHRAIDKTLIDGELYFQTKGDNNLAPDNWDGNWKTKCDLPANKIVGKVIYRVPLLGHLSLFMQSNAGMLVIIALMIALIVIGYIPWPKQQESNNAQS